MEYGTWGGHGSAAHDQKTLNLPGSMDCRQVVIRPEGASWKEDLEEARPEDGLMVNSGPFNGLDNRTGQAKIIEYVEARVLAVHRFSIACGIG